MAQSGLSERPAVMSAFGGKADMGHRTVPIISAASDPKRTKAGLKSRSAAPSYRIMCRDGQGARSRCSTDSARAGGRGDRVSNCVVGSGRRRGGAPHRNRGRVQVAARRPAESGYELADTKSAKWAVTAMIRRSISLMLAIGYFVMAITAVAACTRYPPLDTFRGAKRWRSSRY